MKNIFRLHNSFNIKTKKINYHLFAAQCTFTAFLQKNNFSLDIQSIVLYTRYFEITKFMLF